MARESAKEWFDRFPDLGKSPLFKLRATLHDSTKAGHPEFNVTIRAWEGPSDTHTTLFCELKVGRAVLFPRECFTVGIPSHSSIDGKYAREAVMSLFCMKPGDTDSDFFADYTPEQLHFAEYSGEELSMVKDSRYCDSETGEVRE